MPEALDEEAGHGVAILELDGGLPFDEAQLVTDTLHAELAAVCKPGTKVKSLLRGCKAHR